MKKKTIYESYIKNISRGLTRDFHLCQDLAQEMRLYLVRIKHFNDAVVEARIIRLMKFRAIDYMRKFLKGQIPFGSAADIENLLYGEEE
jgi:hypothetical protein